jgi:hypothetical protein
VFVEIDDGDSSRDGAEMQVAGEVHWGSGNINVFYIVPAEEE